MERSFAEFLEAQERSYGSALDEMLHGKKRTHWMWFIFPQIAGLGVSNMSKKYALHSLQEAKAYLEHKILGQRLPIQQTQCSVI